MQCPVSRWPVLLSDRPNIQTLSDLMQGEVPPLSASTPTCVILTDSEEVEYEMGRKCCRPPTPTSPCSEQQFIPGECSLNVSDGKCLMSTTPDTSEAADN